MIEAAAIAAPSKDKTPPPGTASNPLRVERLRLHARSKMRVMDTTARFKRLP